MTASIQIFRNQLTADFSAVCLFCSMAACIQTHGSGNESLELIW